MKLNLAVIVLFSAAMAFAQGPQQIVINVDRQDFKPLQEASWKILAGNSSISRTDSSVSRSGNGLGVGAEKMFTERFSAGAYFANIRTVTSKYDYSNMEQVESRENMNILSAYGKFSFVNYPVNKWNLIQLSLLGGAMAVDKGSSAIEAIYGAAASYNYDNLIGFELNTKVNLEAQASTSANLIGYF